MSATQTSPVQLEPETLQVLQDLGLADEVLGSRSLLDLEDDWDDEGSPGYAEATWNRAVEFLVRLVSRLKEEYGLRLSDTQIMPGSYGNIDIHLRMPRAELWLSFPPSASAPPRYYAHDETETRIAKGTLDPASPNLWLAAWLAE